MKIKNRAVFLDRDGTINEEVSYLKDLKDLKILPEAPGAIKLLNEHSFKVVVITNQSGVARGYLTEEKLEEIHEEMRRQLSEKGAQLDAIYYCPHHPTQGKGKYRKNCWCRKPNPGMLERAASELELDLGRCYVVGDKLIDLQAGLRVDCKTVLVLTGYGKKYSNEKIEAKINIDYVAKTLKDAAEWITNQKR
ncbi:D-glycero-beta-D-manno-heptose-1,7-bisphosphate 7-phosphatase [subsurface metagenome]